MRFLGLFVLLFQCPCYNKGLEVLYYLFTRTNPILPIEIDEDTAVNASKPTNVVTHSYIGNGLETYLLEIKNKFLKKEDCNVILIDWSMNNGGFERGHVVAKVVGMQIGEELSNWFSNYKLLHFVGTGGGAAVMAYAARQINKNSENKELIRRLSLLDPMVTFFNASNQLEKLDARVASSVIVYHCDNYIGISTPVGTVDFYINGGVRPQPGCHDNNIGPFESIYGDSEKVLCSIVKCRSYFLNSFNSNITKALKCNSSEEFYAGLCNGNQQIIFGENLPEDAKGTYFVNITEKLTEFWLV